MARVRVSLRKQKGQMVKDGTYNIKISISHKEKTRFIGTTFYVLPEQFNSGQVVDHTDAADYNIELRNIQNLYDKKIRDLGGRIDYMDISSLVNLLRDVDPEGRDGDFLFFGEKVVSELKEGGRTSYQLSIDGTLKAIKTFHPTPFLAFQEITPEWLEKFGRNQTRLENSTNTIAIHYRNIRALYNKAIDREKVSQDIYPFRRFKIPTEKPRKRSLTVEEIQKIRDTKLDKKSWQISRDLFMLSFYMIGINFKDLLLANKTDIIEGRLEFKREKTKRPYSIKIAPEALAIINRYPGEEHLLGFIERKRLVNEKKDRTTLMYKDITDQVNRLLKDVAREAKVNRPVSTYYARHSWATIARNHDVPKEDIQAALGHGEDVTDGYIDLDFGRIDRANRAVIDTLIPKKP